ncbi:MAG: RNA polymerase-associated protein RapA, partial [Gammaproteobacteria bacterium]
ARLKGMDLAQNRQLAETVIKSQAERIRVLFQVGEELAEGGRAGVVDEALARMHEELDRELERLSALREVNPNVREDEIEQLQARRELLEIHLKDTRVRLDAVRVIVMR